MNMKLILQDPAVLIATGVILIALVPLFWAFGRLFKKAPSSDEELFAGESPDLSKTDDLFGARPPVRQEPLPPTYPEFSVAPPRDSRSATPAPSAPTKEMVERLDSMSQRLNDMQVVLQRQSTGAAAGTPMSMETIDKLLKIISNVTQQVDQLQRSMGVTPAAPASGAALQSTGLAGPPAGQATPPQGAPRPSPAAVPNSAAEGTQMIPGPGRGIGVAGGALSRPSPAQKPTSGPGGPTTPPPGK